MHAQHEAGKDSAAEIVPPVVPAAPWRVIAVTALPDCRLEVKFVDGLEGIVDMKALVHSEQAGVFAALRDAGVFARAFVECGVVTWPGELDLAPDAMHDEIAARGEWVLQ